MVKKKKQKSPPAEPGRFNHRPFAQLVASVPAPQSPPFTKATPIPGIEAPVSLDEDLSLEEILGDVTPLEGGPVRTLKAPRAQPLLSEIDDGELVMRQLDELVHGDAEFDIADTEEYIEAAVQGLDRRLIKRLRRGEFSIQDHLDLHGLRREEARLRVAKFIEKSHKNGLRCVLIVHGRGLGSKDNIPVLKEKLRAWLTRGAMGKKVLAYTSARPYDGGTGAVYVLLRG